jgi:hypothetical protein
MGWVVVEGYICPKCLITSQSNGFCSHDGVKLLAFNPTCKCGESISIYESFVYGKFPILIIPRLPKFWKFWYGSLQPELSSKYCDKCGKPLKPQFKQYFNSFLREHTGAYKQ